MSNQIHQIAVACTNANGEADLVLITVTVTSEELTNGEHYEKAKVDADLQGYSAPFVCFDYAEQKNIHRVYDNLQVDEYVPPQGRILLTVSKRINAIVDFDATYEVDEVPYREALAEEGDSESAFETLRNISSTKRIDFYTDIVEENATFDSSVTEE